MSPFSTLFIHLFPTTNVPYVMSNVLDITNKCTIDLKIPTHKALNLVETLS